MLPSLEDQWSMWKLLLLGLKRIQFQCLFVSQICCKYQFCLENSALLRLSNLNNLNSSMRWKSLELSLLFVVCSVSRLASGNEVRPEEFFWLTRVQFIVKHALVLHCAYFKLGALFCK